MDMLHLTETVRAALAEDLGRGDVSGQAVAGPGDMARARIITRQDGVLAGADAARLAFQLLDPDAHYQGLADGARLEAGDELAVVHGRARALLAGERVALNFLQRLCGIATATDRAARLAAPVPVADTRKTTPGLRVLEKYAVRVGGGVNHRMGLDDAVLLKENHIALAGGVGPAVAAARRRVGPLVKVEVETETLQQVAQALEAAADVIMLDNMSLEDMAAAARMVAGRALLEASGGIGLDDLPAVAACGVDFVSLGWLTHSAPPLDLSMLIVV